MTNKETRQYAMLVRVRDFGEAHRDLFPDSTVGGQAFARVAAAVRQLSAHVKSKLATAREGRGSKKSARQALIQRLEAIGRTAGLIAETTTGFDDPFRLPQLRRQSDETVLGVGRAFVRDAEPVKSQFIAHALPEMFVAQLEGLVNHFEEAIHGHGEVRTAQTAAQSGITAALESGLDMVRTLDVLVANQLQSDETAMAVWKRERRVGKLRGPRNRKKAAQTTAPATAPASIDVAPLVTAGPAAMPSPAAALASSRAGDVHPKVA